MQNCQKLSFIPLIFAKRRFIRDSHYRATKRIGSRGMVIARLTTGGKPVWIQLESGSKWTG